MSTSAHNITPPNTPRPGDLLVFPGSSRSTGKPETWIGLILLTLDATAGPGFNIHWFAPLLHPNRPRPGQWGPLFLSDGSPYTEHRADRFIYFIPNPNIVTNPDGSSSITITQIIWEKIQDSWNLFNNVPDPIEDFLTPTPNPHITATHPAQPPQRLITMPPATPPSLTFLSPPSLNQLSESSPVQYHPLACAPLSLTSCSSLPVGFSDFITCSSPTICPSFTSCSPPTDLSDLLSCSLSMDPTSHHPPGPNDFTFSSSPIPETPIHRGSTPHSPQFSDPSWGILTQITPLPTPNPVSSTLSNPALATSDSEYFEFSLSELSPPSALDPSLTDNRPSWGTLTQHTPHTDPVHSANSSSGSPLPASTASLCSPPPTTSRSVEPLSPGSLTLKSHDLSHLLMSVLHAYEDSLHLDPTWTPIPREPTLQVLESMEWNDFTHSMYPAERPVFSVAHTVCRIILQNSDCSYAIFYMTPTSIWRLSIFPGFDTPSFKTHPPAHTLPASPKIYQSDRCPPPARFPPIIPSLMNHTGVHSSHNITAFSFESLMLLSRAITFTPTLSLRGDNSLDLPLYLSTRMVRYPSHSEICASIQIPTCPICNVPHKSPSTAKLLSTINQISITCPNGKICRRSLLSSELLDSFWPPAASIDPNNTPHSIPPAPSIIPSADYPISWEDTRPILPDHRPASTKLHLPNTTTHIKIFSHNNGRRTKKILPDLITFCALESPHVLLLQEAPLPNWNPQLFSEQTGLTIFSHNQVMTLVSSTLSPYILDQWHSPQDFNTIFTSVETTTGTLLIVNAYLPTDGDNTPRDSKKYSRIQAQHEEIILFAHQYDMCITNMDANATNSPSSRVQIDRLEPNSAPHYPPPLRDQSISPLDIYNTNFINAHKHHCPSFYPPAPLPPCKQAYTHKQNSQTKRIKSIIDYTLISKSLLPYLTSCILIHEVKRWGFTSPTQKQMSYHKAFITTLSLTLGPANLLPISRKPHNSTPPSHLTTITLGPDESKLNHITKPLLSKAVETSLSSKWKGIRSLYTSKTFPLNKCQQLINIMKNTVTTEAYKILGKKHPPPHTDSDSPTSDTDSTNPHVRLARLIRSLRPSLQNIENPFPDLFPSDHTFTSDHKWLSMRGLNLPPPHFHHDWTTWWPLRQKHSAGWLDQSQADIHITDTDVLAHPKLLYRTLYKSPTTSTIDKLKKGPHLLRTEEEISNELTSYLQKMAKAHEPTPLSTSWTPQRHSLSYHPNTSLSDRTLLPTVHPTDIPIAITNMSTSAASGYDQISTRIINACLQTTWTEEKPPSRSALRERDQADKFLKYLADNRSNLPNYDPSCPDGESRDADSNPPPSEPASAGPQQDHQSDRITVQPIRLRNLIAMIINLCQDAGDIPGTEKLNIVTPIPKKGANITDTNNIRPISVGPFLSRLLHSILARRLTEALTQHNLLDPAQHAFQPGKSTHEAINSILTAFKQYQTDPSQGEGCFTILYDISKAYDNLSWVSIERALERFGIGPHFIDLVMNTHHGTRLAMKLNPTTATSEILMSKGIKQGCPLAPLLFIMVMDELHKQLRSAGGYLVTSTNTTGPHSSSRLSSRGYCDDIAIIANSIESLKRMNSITHHFLTTHSLSLNREKTHVSGRHSDGRPFQDIILWDGPHDPLVTVHPATATRYLGLQISFDLTWSPQIKKMNSIIGNFTSQLHNTKLSPLQGALIYKHVILSQLEAGFKHACIPSSTLKLWDTWITKAFLHRMNLQYNQIPQPALFHTLKTLPPSDAILISQTMHMMETLSKPSELQLVYWHSACPILQHTETSIQSSLHQNRDPALPLPSNYTPSQCMFTRTCRSLLSKGYNIKPNPESRFITIPSPVHKHITYVDSISNLQANVLFDPAHQDMWVARTQDTDIPFMDTVNPWSDTSHPKCPNFSGPSQGLSSTPRPTLHICTDGSTLRKADSPSGVGLAIIEDDYLAKELWHFKGFYWTIPQHDNFMAEMAGINKALHTPSIEQDLVIWTDSLSSIDCIRRARKGRKNHLRCSARPYVNSILHTLSLRDRVGATTELRFVRAHTGARNKQSIGNAEADRLAKWAAYAALPPSESMQVDLLYHELPVVLHNFRTQAPTPNNPEIIHTSSPLHGDLRKHLTSHLSSLQIKNWGTRPKRGVLAQTYPSSVSRLIAASWKSPTSQGIQELLTTTTLYAPKEQLIAPTPSDATQHTNNNPPPTYSHPICTQCTLNVPATITHSFLSCPAQTDLLNTMDNALEAIIPSPSHTNPTLKNSDSLLRELTTFNSSREGPPDSVGPPHDAISYTTIHVSLPGPPGKFYPAVQLSDPSTLFPSSIVLPHQNFRLLLHDLYMLYPSLHTGNPHALLSQLPPSPAPRTPLTNSSPPASLPNSYPTLPTYHTHPSYHSYPAVPSPSNDWAPPSMATVSSQISPILGPPRLSSSQSQISSSNSRRRTLSDSTSGRPPTKRSRTLPPSPLPGQPTITETSLSTTTRKRTSSPSPARAMDRSPQQCPDDFPSQLPQPATKRPCTLSRSALTIHVFLRDSFYRHVTPREEYTTYPAISLCLAQHLHTFRCPNSDYLNTPLSIVTSIIENTHHEIRNPRDLISLAPSEKSGYSWINPTDQLSTIVHLSTLITEAHFARVAIVTPFPLNTLLTHLSEKFPNEHFNSSTISTLDPSAYIQLPRWPSFPGDEPLTTPSTLYVHIIDKHPTPVDLRPFSVSALRDDLLKATLHPSSNIPPTTPLLHLPQLPDRAPLLHPRSPILNSPSFTWYRPLPYRPASGDATSPKPPAPSWMPIALLLGLHPSSIIGSLRANNHPEYSLTPDLLLKIQSISSSSLHDTYRRVEAWRKKKRL